MKIVYVAIATPRPVCGERTITYLSPYVYGVFSDDHQAHDHFEKHGDKECTLKVYSSHYLSKEDCK